MHIEDRTVTTFAVVDGDNEWTFDTNDEATAFMYGYEASMESALANNVFTPHTAVADAPEPITPMTDLSGIDYSPAFEGYQPNGAIPETD